MPACTHESFTRTWPAREPSTRMFSSPRGSSPSSRNSLSSQSSTSPSSPTSMSPLSTSPISTLRRSYSNTFTLIPEERSVRWAEDKSNGKQPSTANKVIKEEGLLVRIILWYPRFFLYILRGVFTFVFYTSWLQLLLVGPTMIISSFMWIFWQTIELPLYIMKWFITALHTPAAERLRRKRTVLISGGSTIQALHMARNFYSAGARVVVFEVEGLFGLARFSTAVSKFYTVPKPSIDNPNDYVKALCEIVDKEKPTYYVPVCVTTPAYYDALAKPHLELAGCSTFLPGAKEVTMLDDTLEVYRRCSLIGITQQQYYIITSPPALTKLYTSGILQTGRHIMFNTGVYGILERHKIVLPNNRQDFHFHHEISENKPWMIVSDPLGDHFVTCTTVKESKVVANVTCQVFVDKKGFFPTENTDIDNWLKVFFNKVKLLRPISGHMSFSFVKCATTGQLYLMGSRVGVSLPYICHTSVHSRVLWKPCPHFSRQNSGPIVQESGRYWMHEAVLNTLRHPSVGAVGKLLQTILDKREALFVYWDPLPYCAYYHVQLPFWNVLKLVRKQNGASHYMNGTLTAPVQ